MTWKCASRHSGVQFFNISTSKSAPNPSVLLLATAACNFSTSELQKVISTSKSVRTPQVFNILTWKCASRHSGVQFFNISTSKSAPNPSVLLLATAACNFSTSELQKVISTSKSVRTPQAFNILTWKRTSRHSGAQFCDI